MASYEAAGPRAGLGAHACQVQQANSGGFRLAQEFDAKTNIKGAYQDGCSMRLGGAVQVRAVAVGHARFYIPRWPALRPLCWAGGASRPGPGLRCTATI